MAMNWRRAGSGVPNEGTGSCTWRTSSVTSPSSAGQRRAQATASSSERAWIVVKPATSSLVSANGPSVTVASPPV